MHESMYICIIVYVNAYSIYLECVYVGIFQVIVEQYRAVCMPV